jgi:ATP-binding cassette subfamily C (CFTR/MRP) protein 1
MDGSFSIFSRSICYVAQTPWIFHGTVRDNILFGLPYNQDLYNKVIDLTALKPDLQILPGGDLTEIGDRGINLSGGQKQRISLARAIYRKDQCDIFIFDDPLSAVDQHVQRQLVWCILNYLQGKTRILVTHQVSILDQMDQIIVMDNGKILDQGTFSGILEKIMFLTYLELSSRGVEFKVKAATKTEEETNEKEEEKIENKKEEKKVI